MTTINSLVSTGTPLNTERTAAPAPGASTNASVAGVARINSTADATLAAPASTKTAAPTNTPATAQASTQVALSSAATSLLAAAGDDGSFDVAKVDRISQAITQGQYSINADVIADKLIANAQDLISRAAPN